MIEAIAQNMLRHDCPDLMLIGVRGLFALMVCVY